MKKILVLCTGNSCRSQMAEGFLEEWLKGKAKVYSAGIVAHGVNPKSIEVMAELGFDISHHSSNVMEEYTAISFDFILTVCDNAKENCPYFPGNAVRLHQNFPDPYNATGTAEEVLDAYRHSRDLIAIWCREFVVKYF